MSPSVWDLRIDRARSLAAELPQAAELLRFYAEIAAFQRTVDGEPLEPHYHRLAALMRRIAPSAVLTETAYLWHLVRQPGAERQARSRSAPASPAGPLCPYCGEKPVAAVLRPEGDGAKRFLLCSLCSSEWEFRRLLCPHCGEESHDKLPVYTAEEFPHVRVEACDTCRVYLKAVDLTRNGLAVPLVDELAAIPLDLWAVGRGYSKLQVNVLGM